MNVESIKLINFRNYNNLSLDLNKKINIFVGKNAQGKTNLLESIYMCATGRSFRTNRDREIINLNKKEAYIGSKINIGRTEKIIEVKLEKDRPKRIKINQIELKNFKELYSGLSVVVFSPDDLKLVKDGPVERRNFLDMSISQIRPIYKYNINKYNKVLFQRNNLLKSNKVKSNIINLIEIFDIQLAKIGTEIIISRFQFIEKLSKIAKETHRKLTLEEELILNYNTNVNFSGKNKKIIEKNFLEQLKFNVDKDLITGITSIGPHRDNMEIEINGADARIFASQGQQRTIVLSIKLSEVEIIRMEKGVYPVLLLDDVFSELDMDRRKYLTKSFNDMQTIITSTDIINLDELKEIEKSIFYIDNGKILK
ncbi:DNA replication/repair protein RecF [Clostridium sp. Cult2]|uniref:DNA replication/repair protein RecF n=1 Tax=Clostridium sp. Cult2 TaxID=2079003 RepID=UPI001EFF742C|nr:DNA replication/repair protein RecF [Clostridium sp. Cult2]MCF6465977.1 DNA replication/repair protein RecF [Clostridium sp. Cult2]